jgi:hypothetical protein
MIKFKAMIRSGFLTKTEEARNSGSFRKRKPRSTQPCSLIGRHQFLIREHLGIQFIGADNEASLARHFLIDPWLIDGDRCHDLPLVSGRARLFAWTPLACMAGMSHEVSVNLQLRWFAVQFTLQGRPCIGLTRKAPFSSLPLPSHLVAHPVGTRCPN